MLVVTAHRQDENAQALVSRWTPYNAHLLTCADLSTRGWRHELHSKHSATAIVDAQVVALAAITGVYTRLPCVFEQELWQIAQEERAYVAAEMTAFLLSWLSSLTCPVLNRPTPICLTGPYWQPGRWLAAAAQAGIPVRPLYTNTAVITIEPSKEPYPQPITLTVVGSRCIGHAHSMLAEQTLLLAQIAHTDLLAVQFSSPEPGAYFVSADPWPELANDEVETAVLNYLQGEAHHASNL